MRRAERNYRGKRPRRGMTGEQAAVAVIAALVLILALTMKVNSQWTGKTCGRQLYEAVFTTKDWE